jgi:hypothetical protein
MFRAHTVLTEYIAWARFKGLAYPFEIITSNGSVHASTNMVATGIVRIIVPIYKE